jgi:hypothetical protein
MKGRPMKQRIMKLRVAAVAGLLALALAPDATADQCHVVDVDFIPADITGGPMKQPLQIVVWVEATDGTYVDTVYMTAETATFGLGNRPGRFDFNSGPLWPYGRRTTVFPVWAHRYEVHRAATNAHPPFPRVTFQPANNHPGDEDNLSHPFNVSSVEQHYCRPLQVTEALWQMADAGSCASQVYTDKGMLGTGTSLYPPRADIAKTAPDHDSVTNYAALNPFDAISGATPKNGSPAVVSWPIPPGFKTGDYVMWVEVSREFDHNATYSKEAFPSPPGIPWSEYGSAYRGQPSILYKVPFSVGETESAATTLSYVGYGAPDGNDGTLRSPDPTITATVVGSGAQRLAVAPGGYRVRVTSRPELDFAAPAAPSEAQLVAVTSHSADVIFRAPGDDGVIGRVKGYELRIRADGQPITEDNFADSLPLMLPLSVNDPGQYQQVTVGGLLFDTPYAVAVRAFDECRNVGPVMSFQFQTAPRKIGEVDACFVATAAYGSAMAADVDMLRRFRDTALARSVLGELAIEAYYTFGPAVAGPVGESDLLRATARAVLDPIVTTVRMFEL